MKNYRRHARKSRLTTLTLVAFVALAASPSAHASHHRNREETLQELMRLAAPSIHALTRDVVAFNYMPRPATDHSFHSLDDRGALNAVNGSVLKSIHDPKYVPGVTEFHDWFGSGMYLALDPIMSVGYAAPDGMHNAYYKTAPWYLTQVTLPGGSLFWDITSTPTFDADLQDDIQRNSKDHQCQAENMHLLLEMRDDHLNVKLSYDQMKRTSAMAQSCHEYVHELIERMKVDTVVYTWTDDAQFRTQLCPGRRPVGLFLTKQVPDGARAPFQADQVRLFTETLPEQPDGGELNRLMIEDIFNEVPWAAAAHRWPTLDAQAITPETKQSTREWIRDHFYSCGDHAEDRP